MYCVILEIDKRQTIGNVIRTCEPGWMGDNCNIADCSSKKNCSGAGYCIRPNECRCILNHYGDDCSLCQGPYCSYCDYHCVHGKCDFITKTCQCSNFWGGSACDVCLDEKKCLSEPKILMLLPQSGPILKQNTFVFAHGTDFPKADSYRYSCIFGGIATEGRWLSSNLIRCLVPPVSHVGKHLFNLIPLNSNIKIGYLENRPIHYTFYVDCNPNVCQGNCMGPQCICGNDRNGLQCENINVLSNEIYNETNVNEELANAFEGVSYRVSVPINSDSTLISLTSEAINYGLRFDAFKGQLIWDNPIGRKEPYEVNFLMNHGFIKYSLKWILNVTPSYEGRIIGINSPDINDVLLRGFVKFEYNSRSFQAPLLILVFSSNTKSPDSLIEIVKIKTAQNGTFTTQLVPYSLPFQDYSLCIIHPGILDIKSNILCQNSSSYSEGTWTISRLTLDYPKVLKCNKNQNRTLSNMIDGNYKIKSLNFDCANSWEFDIIFPREKISVRKLQFADDGNNIMVEFVLKSNQCLEKKFNFTGLVFCPNSRMSGVIRQIIECQEIGFLRTEPEKLFVTINPLSNFTESSSLKIFVNDETRRKELLDNILSDSNIVKPFSVISLDGNDDFIEIELINEKRNNIKNNSGFLYLPNSKNPIVEVPYFIKFSTSDITSFSIYLRSLLDDNLQQNDPTLATIYIKSPSRNVSIVRGCRMNDIVEFGNFKTGVYSISIEASGYNNYYNIETINEFTKILTIFLEPQFPYKPIINNGEYSMERVQNYLKNTPLVSINPSYITIQDDEDTFKQYIELYYEEGIESTFVAFNDVDLIYQTFSLNGKLYELEIDALNDTSLCLGCKMKVLLKITKQEITFDEVIEFNKAIMVKIDYFVLIRSINWNYKGSSDLLVISKNSDKELNLPVVNKYQILCNCYISTLQKCLKDYQSVLGCSKSWERIPDEIVSIHTFANFILLKADCERSGVRIKKIKKLLDCLNDMEQMCPKVSGYNKNPSIHESFPQQLKNTFLSSFTNLKTLELQLNEIPILFNQFLKQLDILIPDNEINQISDVGWFDNFIKFASDYSHGSNEITEQELLRFPNWHQGKSLIFRWNTMNKEMEGEKNPMFTLMSNSSLLAFQDLVEQSDKLKSLSRQFNQDTPFTMLHEVLHTLFSNVETTTSLIPSALDDSCTFNDVYIQNSVERIFEDESFKVILIIKANTRMKNTINNIKLNLEMKKVDDDEGNIQFRIIPNSNKYFSSSKMTVVEWAITPMIMRRLTKEMKFKPVAKLRFRHPISGDIAEQQLVSQIMTISPMEFVRIYWFSYPYVTNENNKDPLRPYTALLSIMNVGYIELRNIELNKVKAYITSEDGSRRVPFKIVKNNTLMKIPVLLSGESIHIPFDFYLEKDDQGILTNLTLQLTTNGRFPAHIQSRNFNILQSINNKKLIVYENNFYLSTIYYDIEHNKMTPIQESVVSSSKNKTVNINGNEFKLVILNVQRKSDQENESRSGPLLIQHNISSILNEPSDQIIEISANINGITRYIEYDNIWINDGKLYFTDLEARNNQENLQYVAVIGENKWNTNFSKIYETLREDQNTTSNFENHKSTESSNNVLTTEKYTTLPVITETLFPLEKTSTQFTNIVKGNKNNSLSSNKVISKTTLPNIISTSSNYNKTFKYTTPSKMLPHRNTSRSPPKLTEKENDFKNSGEKILTFYENNLSSTTKTTLNYIEGSVTPTKENFYFSILPSSTKQKGKAIPFDTTQAPKQIGKNSTKDNDTKESPFIFSNGNNNIEKNLYTNSPSSEFPTKEENGGEFIFVESSKTTKKVSNDLLTPKPTEEIDFYNLVTTTNSYSSTILNTVENDTNNIFLPPPVKNISTTTLTYPEKVLPPIDKMDEYIKENNNRINNYYETSTGVETLFPSTKDDTSTKSIDSSLTQPPEKNMKNIENSENDFSSIFPMNDVTTIHSTTNTNGNLDLPGFVFAPFTPDKLDGENSGNKDATSGDYFKKVALKIQNNPREMVQMACNNKRTHPIWEIICDLDKIFEIESNL
uniref:EGF-like domain-containing protein n=1 Tax=Strongyloides papillosus TaxID=174720 RepID=A0A0N5BKN6_STREA